jgi:small subunit ribosomal protein S16
MGRTHRPYYRIVAQNKRTWRDGKFFDILGTWDPYPDKFGNKKLRLQYWIGVGAPPSEAVADVEFVNVGTVIFIGLDIVKISSGRSYEMKS